VKRVDHSEVNNTEWKSMIRALASCIITSLLSATPAVAQNHSYFSTPHYGGGYNYRHSSTGNFGTFCHPPNQDTDMFEPIKRGIRQLLAMLTEQHGQLPLLNPR
jgi:hypothetical protein